MGMGLPHPAVRRLPAGVGGATAAREGDLA